VNDESIIPCGSDFNEALNGNTTETQTIKETAKIVNLPFDADLEAEVVVSNTHFDSDPSNTIKFSTPKGGKLYCEGFSNAKNNITTKEISVNTKQVNTIFVGGYLLYLFSNI
jgi:hypothetical protein